MIHGDCLEAMRGMPSDSFDAVVTDPPAGISFMGKEWDHDRGGRDAWVAWMAEVMAEALRVTKPGGHALVWALPRTSHWTAWACETAGWEVRDRVHHLFGSGFPKSLDVGKAIDRAAGAEREVVGSRPSPRRIGTVDKEKWGYGDSSLDITAPATDDAKAWDGWGTALKPAAEDWWLLRKPLSEKSVAANVLRWGTGAINIGGARVGSLPRANPSASGGYMEHWGREPEPRQTTGRWPSNLVLSHGPGCNGRCLPGCPVAELDAQSGQGTSSRHQRLKPGHDSRGVPNAHGIVMRVQDDGQERGHDDSGGASRFYPTFKYVPKAPSSERPVGPDGTRHPTVKSQGLMRWLVTLVCPPGGTVLDPFAGSGSTLEAAAMEGRGAVGIEADAAYIPLIEERVARPVQPYLFDMPEEVRPAG